MTDSNPTPSPTPDNGWTIAYRQPGTTGTREHPTTDHARVLLRTGHDVDGTRRALAALGTALVAEFGQPLQTPRPGTPFKILAYGDPATGFEFVGPAVPDEDDTENFILNRIDPNGTDWWFIDVRPLVTAKQDTKLNLDDLDQNQVTEALCDLVIEQATEMACTVNNNADQVPYLLGVGFSEAGLEARLREMTAPTR